ncbi:MAG: D-alanyl-D-alanine carboxypeptidase/D-alanyl-D-alanine-endopeptidase [Pseudonocardiales bacterium]|nr:MAG: D-alanyl-D-alanine carboxypeptidase/D-alanyl-D-alanine-endopeptidase [Pseudonocardiales bacterium]
MTGWRGRVALVVAAAVVLAIAITTAVVVLVLRPGGRHPTAARPGPTPVAPAPSPVLLPGRAGPLPTSAGVGRALAGLLRDSRLGSRLSYSVVDADTGQALAAGDAARPATPASVTKLTTAFAVLAGPGPLARITTRVVTGAAPGDIVLVGGGDPTLSVDGQQAYPGAPRLDVFAAAIRTAYGRPIRRVIVDGSAYTGPAAGRGWDSDLVSSGNVAPITAVMVNGGRVNSVQRSRSTAPDLAAGQALARLLGVPASAVSRGTAPPGAAAVTSVVSATFSVLVEEMLAASDNVLAEALARQVAISRHQPASFDGAAAAVRVTLAGAGIDVGSLRLVDGSGLSRLDLIPAGLLTGLLSAASRDDRPRLRALLTGLPVAGFTGTLDSRYRVGATRVAAGEVRAKTGTLSGVSTLAGVVRDTDGRLLAFAVLADRVPAGGTRGAEAALDAVATALSRCGCR